MCKLKAALAWEHSCRPAPAELFLPIFPDENITENNDEPNTPNISHEESSKEPNESVEDENDENDEISELTPLEEFGQFLNVWVDISTSEIEEITQIYEDEDEMLTSEVEDISYPAINPNSKWDLRTLFKELPLSFFI
ncbi:hypothetical protein C2G38_2038669 [Gigaspora rosea]|uniref:Uncharacterized protein n=1 Tax=Gigaspora rosea TaxID=44941 RepID=A0A397URL6_9GLOM|nr:hypothetical protein C2G38_2041460 [Gigaspora rosea]RIB16330.1 hypothetical protein C2G38_2038669 [Gigaspora rosea]